MTLEVRHAQVSQTFTELVVSFEGFARASCKFRGLCPELVLTLPMEYCKASQFPNDAGARIWLIMTSR